MQHFQNGFPPVTLAIDYGVKRIGLAISRANLSEPFKVLKIPQFEDGVQESTSSFELSPAAMAFVIDELKSIIRVEKVEQLVVGVSEGKMAEASKEFAGKLKQAFELPVHLADETLSSETVSQKLRQIGKRSSSGKQSPIDHYAAAEILETFLELD